MTERADRPADEGHPGAPVQVGSLGGDGRVDPRELARFIEVGAAAFGMTVSAGREETLAAVLDPSRCVVARVEGEQVGVAASFAVDLTLPGGVSVPVAAVSDVGVLPTHRRRGVLTELMRHQLTDLASRGEVAAVLHASEAGIYDRFGYGVATRSRHIRARRDTVRLRGSRRRTDGSIHVVDRTAARTVLPTVHDRVHRAMAGSLSRPEPWWDVVFGDVELYMGGGANQLVMVHTDRDGTADGYAIYRITPRWGPVPAHEMTVWELLGVDDGVVADLWETLLSHDLVATVSAEVATDDLLFEITVDPRQLQPGWEQDLLWLRPLDIERLLGERSYAAAGSLVIEVVDDMSIVGGNYLLESDGYSGSCSRTDRPAELRMSASELARMALGGGSARRAVRAGRVEELRDGAATLVDTMMTTDPAPWCWVRF